MPVPWADARRENQVNARTDRIVGPEPSGKLRQVMGNLPQAVTHLALISAAAILAEADDAK